MIIWLNMAHNSWILNLIDNNVIGMNGKHIIVIIYVCYKISSNFAPNKEELFFIFPFVSNMFHSSCQWVPIGNPIILWGDHMSQP